MNKYEALKSLSIDGMAEFLSVHITCIYCPIDYCGGDKCYCGLSLER